MVHPSTTPPQASSAARKLSCPKSVPASGRFGAGRGARRTKRHQMAGKRGQAPWNRALAAAAVACCIAARLQTAAGFASFPMLHLRLSAPSFCPAEAECLVRHRVCPALRLEMAGQPARSRARGGRGGRGGAGRRRGGRGEFDSISATGAARGGRAPGLKAGQRRGTGGPEETIVCIRALVLLGDFLLIQNAFLIIDSFAPAPYRSRARPWRLLTASCCQVLSYHKKAGLVTTHKDELGRETVYQDLQKSLPPHLKKFVWHSIGGVSHFG